MSHLPMQSMKRGWDIPSNHELALKNRWRTGAVMKKTDSRTPKLQRREVSEGEKLLTHGKSENEEKSGSLTVLERGGGIKQNQKS